MRAWVRRVAEATGRIIASIYRDVLVFGGAGAVYWGLSGYDVRVAAVWVGLFCVWMGLGAPGIARGG